jgi:hypothetical protein
MATVHQMLCLVVSHFKTVKVSIYLRSLIFLRNVDVVRSK